MSAAKKTERGTMTVKLPELNDALALAAIACANKAKAAAEGGSTPSAGETWASAAAQLAFAAKNTSVALPGRPG